MLAEICHGGYTDALRFLLERGEQLLHVPFLLLFLQGLVQVLRKAVFQVYSGGEVFPPVWPGCHAAKMDRSLKKENTSGWTPRSFGSYRSASGQVRGRSHRECQVTCRPPEHH